MKNSKNLRYITVLFVLLAMILTGCGESQGASANKSGGETIQTSQSIFTELEKGNWYEANVTRLNDMIHTHGIANKEYDKQAKPYAVFDWDQTTIFHDIGEAVFTYQIENLVFKMTPESFSVAIKTNIPTDNFIVEKNNLKGEAVNIEKISDDLNHAYTFIYQHYQNFEGTQSLETVKESPEYQDFSVKLRYLYEAIGATFSPDISYPWVTYLFSGMTSQEVQTLSKKAIDAGLQEPIEEVTWESPSGIETTAGQVSVTFDRGIRTQPEVQNLYQTLMKNGIDVYVCSASFIDVIIPFATDSKYGYQIPEANVFAMRLQKNQDTLESKFDSSYPQTQGEGKFKTIKEYIAPKHQEQSPILIAGDSDGDYQMLKGFHDLKIGLIFNRNKNGRIGELCEEAVKTREEKNPTYLLQGRNENTGKLIPMEETILFGEKEPTLGYEK